MTGRTQRRGAQKPSAAKKIPEQVRASAAPTVRELQRARIIAAMTSAVARRGIEKSSVTRVLRDARIPRIAFYQQFSDRDECIHAALETAITGARIEVEAALDSSSSWRGQVRAGLEALLGHFEREPDAARLGLMSFSPISQPALAQLRAEAAAQLAGAIAAGPASPAAVTPEAIVAGVVGVIDAQLAARNPPALMELTGALMSFIVLPYEGPDAAREELQRPAVGGAVRGAAITGTEHALPALRVTYRTMRVLRAVGERPGLSNTEVAERAGITDPGQVSKLLKRLLGTGLIENTGAGASRGAANSWWLSPEGEALERRLGVNGRPNRPPERRQPA